MFSGARSFLLAAVAAVVAPVAASAAVFNYDVNVGMNYSFAEVISPGSVVEFKFTVLDDVKISAFAVSGTGTGATAAEAEDDVRDIAFGFSLPSTTGFSVISSSGTTAAGFGFLPGGTFRANDMFSIFFQDGIINDVGLTLSFTTDPAPIPLPAAGLLLAPVLVAGGVAAARCRKAVAQKA